MFRLGTRRVACSSLSSSFSPSYPSLSTLSRSFSSHAGGKVEDLSVNNNINTTIHHVETPTTSTPPSPSPSSSSPSSINYMQDSTETDLKKYSHLFANPRVKEIIDRIVRVDQAGEFGAARIYDGQLAVLKNTKEGPLIEHMAEQEREHQATFNHLVRHFRVRPTLLTPMWNMAGFALGALPALGGKELAMAVTVAVETVIGDHYNHQLRLLHEEGLTQGDYELLRKFIRRFRDDEMEHHDIGLEHDATKAPFYSFFFRNSKSWSERSHLPFSQNINYLG